MRRVFAVSLSLVAILGMVAPASAQAPAPKVTINGLVDFVTTAYKNWSGGGACIVIAGNNCVNNDVTDSERGWYSRERGVFTITGEVGKAKGVWALELDFTNGVNATANAGGNITNSGAGFPGTTTGFDLDTDVAGAVETKWLYVEAPIFGAGSILPFIPVTTVLRAGGQPARGHDYKPGILLSGDIPAVTLESTFAPNLRSTLTYLQMREHLDRALSANQAPGTIGEAWGVVASVEVDVFKGLTVKPTYAYVDMMGGSGNASLGRPAVNGFQPNGTTLQTHRHTLGGDVRWTAGPFTFQPTFYFQWGDQDIAPTAGTSNVDIWTWIADATAGFRTGPLNVEVRGMWTPGMSAGRRVQAGSDVGYYQPINPAFSYLAGWSEIWTGGVVDYITAFAAGVPGVSARTSPSYDKYGRRFVGVALDYSLTPALTLHGIANASWTEQKVDVNGDLTSNGLNSVNRGDERFLGTEVVAGLTYRFAPNVAFDLAGAILFSGDALNHARVVGGPVEDSDNIYKATARVRFTF